MVQQAEHVIIGVNLHKLSATIEVADQNEQMLGSGRFTTDQAGHTAMRSYAKTWPDRVWAVEGANAADGHSHIDSSRPARTSSTSRPSSLPAFDCSTPAQL